MATSASHRRQDMRIERRISKKDTMMDLFAGK